MLMRRSLPTTTLVPGVTCVCMIPRPQFSPFFPLLFNLVPPLIVSFPLGPLFHAYCLHLPPPSPPIPSQSSLSRQNNKDIALGRQALINIYALPSVRFLRVPQRYSPFPLHRLSALPLPGLPHFLSQFMLDMPALSASINHREI